MGVPDKARDLRMQIFMQRVVTIVCGYINSSPPYDSPSGMTVTREPSFGRTGGDTAVTIKVQVLHNLGPFIRTAAHRMPDWEQGLLLELAEQLRKAGFCIEEKWCGGQLLQIEAVWYSTKIS
jgi:hypothetical protein